MAEQSTDPLELLFEKVYCPECGNKFQNPKRLPCLHNICLTCLRPLLKSRIVECPCCQQETGLESGKVDNLPDSPYLASLVRVAETARSKTKQMKCAFCDKFPTTLQEFYHLPCKYCPQCDTFCCKDCETDQHDENNDDHRFVALEDIPQDQQSPLKQCTKCPKKHHTDQELDYFCISCVTALCKHCTLTTTKHKDHKVEVLKSVAEDCKSQIESLIDKQIKEAQRRKDEILQIDKECEEVESQATEVETVVNEFLKEITQCLETEKEKILAATKKEAERSLVQLKRQKRLIQNHEEVITAATETTAALLKHSTSLEIIDLSKLLHKIVKKVEEEKQDHHDPERKPLQMKFLKAPEAKLIVDTKKVGILQIRSETSADNSCVEGDGIIEAYAGLSAQFIITTKNADGYLYYNKRDRITVELKDGDGKDARAEMYTQDGQDGSYKISYFAKQTGELKASVKVNEEPVNGSPFTVQVKTRQFNTESILGETEREKTERWGLAVSDNDEIVITDSISKGFYFFIKTERDQFGELAFNKKAQIFEKPSGIIFDRNGNLLVADSAKGVVQMFSFESGEYLYKGKMFGEDQLKSPEGLSIDKGGNIIVADSENKLIKIFSSGGEFIGKIGGENKEEGHLIYPIHCVQCDNYFIVSDTFAHAIKVFDQEGAFLYQFGGKGELNSPRCLGVDKLGYLLVCDSGNNRIQVFEPNESSLNLIATIGKKGSEEGEFEQPFSVGVLSDGKIVVNDVGNKRLQKIA